MIFLALLQRKKGGLTLGEGLTLGRIRYITLSITDDIVFHQFHIYNKPFFYKSGCENRIS